MKTRYLMKNNAGFSSVIAALILMLLAVASGVVVYGYVMGWLGGATNVANNTKGILEFDSLYADATSGDITIYVRNVGQKELTLQSVYVDGVSKYSALNEKLEPGVVSNAITVNFTTMIAGQTFEVRVSCTDGTFISQSVVAK